LGNATAAQWKSEEKIIDKVKDPVFAPQPALEIIKINMYLS
jgi:hypothetical protein